MSPAAEAMQKVVEILGEHFDQFVVVGMEAVSAEEGGRGAEALRIETGDSRIAALGLLEQAKHELLGPEGEFIPDGGPHE